jgi:cyclase
MPLAYGGGIQSLDDIKKIFNCGVEKVVINSAALKNPDLIKEASEQFGNQSIVGSIDVKLNNRDTYETMIKSGSIPTGLDPIEHVKYLESLGVGEIFINSIDQDGLMNGYDNRLIKMITDAVNIPVIACGGAGKLEHFSEAVRYGGASAVAAGSFFVFHGNRRAVLISYPTKMELENTFNFQEK